MAEAKVGPKRGRPRTTGGGRGPNKLASQKKVAKRSGLVMGSLQTTYTEEIGESICEMLSQGILLNEVCRRHKISARRLWDWQHGFPEFHAKVVIARQIGVEALISEAQSELRNVLGSTVGPEVSAANNLASFYKWISAKLYPLQYGERIEVENNVKITDERTSLRNKILAAFVNQE